MIRRLIILLLIVGCAPTTSTKKYLETDIYGLEYKSGYNSKIAYIDSIRNTNSIPLILTKVSTIGANELGGHKPTIGYEIFTDKEIKYLKFKVSFFNRVMDKVACTIQGQDEYLLSITGVLKKGDSATENLWSEIFNTDIDCMMIDEVIIEYMDGEIISYVNDEILSLLVPYELFYYYGIINVNYQSYGKRSVERCCNFN